MCVCVCVCVCMSLYGCTVPIKNKKTFNFIKLPTRVHALKGSSCYTGLEISNFPK